MFASEMMSAPVKTISPEATIGEALRCFCRSMFRPPVMDAGGRLVGIVSDGDFLHRAEIGTAKAPVALDRIPARPGRKCGSPMCRAMAARWAKS